MSDFDFVFKGVVVGDAGVGKTSMVRRFGDGTFSEKYNTTIGVEFVHRTKIVQVNGVPKNIKLQLWDTAGQERFQAMVNSYYRGAHVLLVVFAVNDMSSFQKVPDWLQNVAKVTHVDYKILVGNKCDVEAVEVSDDLATRFAKENEMYEYVKTSAKTGENIDDLFVKIMTQLAQKLQTSQVLGEKAGSGVHVGGENVHNRRANNQNVSRSCCGGTN